MLDEGTRSCSRAVAPGRRSRGSTRASGSRRPPRGRLGIVPLIGPYEVGSRRERIVYLSHPGDMTAYEELRTGFTAPSRTSCGRRSPGCSRCSRWRRCPARTSTRSSIAPATRSSRRGSSSTRCCSSRSSSRVAAWSRSGRWPCGPSSTSPSRARGARRRGPASRCASRATGHHARDAAPHAPGGRAEPGRERDALRRPGYEFHARRRARGRRVVLRGADDGVGVNEEELSRLFERFYRADRARASRGTGLGLAIVKHIVGQAGGDVEARGGKGAGLEIRCVFPRAAA